MDEIHIQDTPAAHSTQDIDLLTFFLLQTTRVMCGLTCIDCLELNNTG